MNNSYTRTKLKQPMTNTTRSLQICWVLFPTSLKFSDRKGNYPRNENQTTQMHSKNFERKLCDKKYSNRDKPDKNRPLQNPFDQRTNLISKAGFFSANL
jgi:hypothetical protein